MSEAKHIIHVNRQFIGWNNKNPDKAPLPVYTIKSKGIPHARYCSGFEADNIRGRQYDGKQLSCGAVVWLETDDDIRLINEVKFSEVKKMQKS